MFYKFLLFDLDHTLLDFDAAEDVALTQLLKEEGVADIQAYKDYYVPMNKALWKDLFQSSLYLRTVANSKAGCSFL
ncbi:HAD superfamily hydrolase [Streptococcus pneumoniae]|nr:HAD superfamily hydrolase [Streptococcus pneumoniae]